MKRIKEFIVSENPPISPNVGWVNIKDGNPELQFNINGEFKEFTSSRSYIQLPFSVLETEPFNKAGQEGEDELNKIFAPYTFRDLCDKILKDKITTIEFVSNSQNVLYNCSILIQNRTDGGYTYCLNLFLEEMLAMFHTSLSISPSSRRSSSFSIINYLAKSSLKTINGQSIVGYGNITIPKGDDGEDGVTPAITCEATVDGNTGTPEVAVTKEGTNEAPTFTFAFKNLKGATGAKGDTGATGEQGPQGEIGPQGPQGAKGDKGDKGEQGTPGTNGTNGKSIKSIELISNGTTITGGTATMDDDSTIPITVTTQSE